uniref:Uncharacterized protein n=1 Tax=Solanum tuberosum TaxID=4113 RepID=M1BF98_SOLTU
MAVAISLIRPARLRHHQSPRASSSSLFFSGGGAATRGPTGTGRLRSFFRWTAADDNSSISHNSSNKCSSCVRHVHRRKLRTAQTKQSYGQRTLANPFFFPEILNYSKRILTRSVQVLNSNSRHEESPRAGYQI